MAEASFNNTENILCPYFMGSSCRYGDMCRFSHRFPNPPMNGMCKFYLQGKCRFGDNCWNSHGPEEHMATSIYPTQNKPSPGPSRIRPEARNSISPSKPNRFVGQLPQHQPRFQSRNEVMNLSRNPISRLPDRRNVDWVNASEFIPASAMPNDSFIGEQKQVNTLCSDFINGICHSGDRCYYIHGDMCKLCFKACLNPLDKNQQKKHTEECTKEQGSNQQLSIPMQRSVDKACGICLDVIIEKNVVNERKFGILENCNHIFCFTCIMKWRKVKSRSREIENFVDPSLSKACPECRIPSDFITPSKYWFDTEADKQKLIADHKAYLMTKHCKSFKRGSGHCPYGAFCYNLHVLPNGEKVNLPPPDSLENTFRPRELDFMSRYLLMDLYDTSEDLFSSDSEFDEIDDDFEELFLHHLELEIVDLFDY